MQESSGKPVRLPNPLLDLTVVGLEAQLKAWQAYQVEGTQFVAKRMRASPEHLRALGHCCDVQSVGDCHRAWLRGCQADYAEEWGRIAATSFALCFADLSGLGWLFGQRTSQVWPKSQPEPLAETVPQSSSRPRPRRAAA